MTEGSPAGWYPDPSDPAHLRFWDGTHWGPPTATPPASPAKVFGRTFLYGFLITVITAAGSATAGAPVIGTLVGAIVGVVIGVPVGLVVATIIALSARPPVTAKTYRLRIDVTLVVLGLATCALAAVWIGQHALAGLWPPLTMVVLVLVSLLVVRPRLRRLGPAQLT